MKSQKNKKLRVLFVSGELIAGDLAYRLKKEGCDVKLYIEDKSRKDCFDGMIKKTNNWRKELEWVGKNGLIVFDDVDYGKIQDKLRADGYNVFGGNTEGDRLEKEREFAQKIIVTQGINVKKSKDFNDIESAINYIKNNKTRWTVKKNDKNDFLSYVGILRDGNDTISFLEQYKNKSVNGIISLQKSVDGVEVAIARYFNGNDWTSPIFVSFEHKPLMNNDLGPLTPEMGTLAWYDKNENNKLFLATLAKLKPYLQKINYCGYVDINSIFNEDKVYPLEMTMRLAYPTNQLQSEMQTSSWKELLTRTAKGERFNLKYKRGFSVVVMVAVPPFPYKSVISDYCLKDTEILFKNKLTKNELDRIHFDEVSFSKIGGKERYYLASKNGFALCVTGSGKTVQEARKQAYDLIDKIVIPKMFYRTDIGLKFIEKDQKLLKKWGWI